MDGLCSQIIMSSQNQKGKKRSKAFYRKSAFGSNKKQCTGANRLEPGLKGFLITCNSNESSAVREAYNILNEYADQLYGQGQSGSETTSEDHGNIAVATSDAKQSDEEEEDSDEDGDDMEKALKKEVASMKTVPTTGHRFQNCATKAKNCIFIRSTVSEPVKVAVRIMEDIAEKKVSRARYAARILPVVGTCKAHTSDIEQLVKQTLSPIFSSDKESAPKSFAVLFRTRNNNTTTCGKTSVVPVVSNAVREINPNVEFSWSDFEVAVLVEIVCTVCCLCVAPGFTRLRKYNLQELVQGPRPPKELITEGSAGEKSDSVTEHSQKVDEGSAGEKSCSKSVTERSQNVGATKKSEERSSEQKCDEVTNGQRHASTDDCAGSVIEDTSKIESNLEDKMSKEMDANDDELNSNEKDVVTSNSNISEANEPCVTKSEANSKGAEIGLVFNSKGEINGDEKNCDDPFVDATQHDTVE